MGQLNPFIYDAHHQDDTEALAVCLANQLQPSDCLCLEGELGGGKSTFVRALIRELMAEPDLEVPSPTFSLVQYYPDGRLPCIHADLYRLHGPEDTEQLDLFNAPESLTLIEWPDRAGSLLPTDRLHISFSIPDLHNLDRRLIHITAFGQGWPLRLQSMVSAFCV